MNDFFSKSKTRARLFVSVYLATLIFLTGFFTVRADYRFSIPEDLVIFWVEKDGTVSISYEFTIQNYGQEIDYIDIGMPNNDFSLRDVIAKIDDQTVDQDKISYVDPDEVGYSYGITIDNTENPIPRNAKADIYVEVQNIKNVLYLSTDSNDSTEYVSFQFMPNYFGSDFTTGTTKLTVRLVLPSGMSSSDPIYFKPKNWIGNDEPNSWITTEGNIVYEWQSDEADSSSSYIFGAKFPKKFLNPDVKIQTESQVKSNNSSAIGALIFIFVVGLLIIIPLIRSFSSSKKKKNNIVPGSYLPPSIKAEGEGIKRGLTAVEAAVLLEKRIDTIISMIIFSLVKKNAIQVIQQNPLKIKVSEPLPEGLYDYEKGFIEAMTSEKDSEKKAKMEKTISNLINSVAEKMKGYSLEETKAYYRAIIEKAWDQVKEAGTPELKGEKLDEIFGWAILDEDVDKKSQEVFGDYPVFLPTWWWRVGPVYASPTPSHPASSSGTPSPSVPSPLPTPTLPGADFARSITDTVRNFGEGTVGEIKSFTQNVIGHTNPAAAHSGSSNRRSSSGRGGSGGGFSCACACACAGCACACAGGGGGR